MHEGLTLGSKWSIRCIISSSIKHTWIFATSTLWCFVRPDYSIRHRLEPILPTPIAIVFSWFLVSHLPPPRPPFCDRWGSESRQHSSGYQPCYTYHMQMWQIYAVGNHHLPSLDTLLISESIASKVEVVFQKALVVTSKQPGKARSHTRTARASRTSLRAPCEHLRKTKP